MPRPERPCEHCGYDLAGLRSEGVCPECGKAPDPNRPRRLRRRRLAISAAAMAAALYGPYAWLLVIDYPWNEYRWLWIRTWLALPTMLPATLARRLIPFELDSTLTIITMSAAGLLLLAGLAWLGARGRRALLIAAAAVLALSILNSFGLYHMFRA